MKPKLYGIGKCGTRIVFDFSAFTYAHPTAFEVRLQPQGVGHVVSAYNRLQRALSELTELVWSPGATPVRIYTKYSSVAIESDLNGNEVTKLLTDEISKRMHVAPVETVCQLGDRTGGCGFGAVSESIATSWVRSNAYPVEMTLDARAEDLVAFVACSLGGGTGSGAAQVVASKIAGDYARRNPNRPCHVSLIGVLPMTDIEYGNEAKPVWDFGDRINTGRAIASFLGRTQLDATKPDPGLWLISNDLLRLQDQAVAKAEQGIHDRSISIVNWHFAAVACLLSNVGGAGDINARGASLVRAQANLDSAEMNQHFGGRTYFTGYAGQIYDQSPMRAFARRLCRQALEPLNLAYSFSPQSAPVGCSIPFRTQFWNQQALDKWCESSGSAEAAPMPLPAELRTAGWVGVLYGQPSSSENGQRAAAVFEAIGELFPGANIQHYPFIHQYDKQDHLCLFVVDSFSSVAFAALTHYVVETFGPRRGFAEEVQTAFARGEEDALSLLLAGLNERESYSNETFGSELSRLDETCLLDRKTVDRAYRRLYRAYQRKSRTDIKLQIG